MSFEFRQNFLEQFESKTQIELDKVLKDQNITLYKMQGNEKDYIGYFTYDGFRINIKVQNGVVTQAVI